jgi:hypothetical protein
MVYPAPPFFIESLHGRSNQSLPALPLHMDAEEIIPTFLTSNIYISLCLLKALPMTHLRSYKMFDVLLIFRINQAIGLWEILKFHLLSDAFLYPLAREISVKLGVPYTLQ